MTDTKLEWPWQYNFPPFFTLQPHTETRARQIEAWKTLIIEYFKVNKLSSLDVREIADVPLFNNTAINRTIEPKLLTTVLDELQKTGYASPLDKQKNRWEIYWHTLEELGSIVYNYINNSNNLNRVLTLFELTEGEDVVDEVFYKLNVDVFIKVLELLEADGKCVVILFEGSQGVKFV